MSANGQLCPHGYPYDVVTDCDFTGWDKAVCSDDCRIGGWSSSRFRGTPPHGDMPVSDFGGGKPVHSGPSVLPIPGSDCLARKAPPLTAIEELRGKRSYADLSHDCRKSLESGGL